MMTIHTLRSASEDRGIPMLQSQLTESFDHDCSAPERMDWQCIQTGVEICALQQIESETSETSVSVPNERNARSRSFGSRPTGNKWFAFW
jgi:hypothetical protein